MSTAFVAGGIGVAIMGGNDVGFSNIGLALIDKKRLKVLYFSRRSANINPLEFSSVIKQLGEILMKF